MPPLQQLSALSSHSSALKHKEHNSNWHAGDQTLVLLLLLLLLLLLHKGPLFKASCRLSCCYDSQNRSMVRTNWSGHTTKRKVESKPGFQRGQCDCHTSRGCKRKIFLSKAMWWLYIKRTNVMQLGSTFICNCNIALHVSDAFCVHLQEHLETVEAAFGEWHETGWGIHQGVQGRWHPH